MGVGARWDSERPQSRANVRSPVVVGDCFRDDRSDVPAHTANQSGDEVMYELADGNGRWIASGAPALRLILGMRPAASSLVMTCSYSIHYTTLDTRYVSF